jgi:2-amino-4-hydroxy-6-hydroxymethyldihydropteridine diphosphokinase
LSEVFIALGTNMGDKQANLDMAIKMLAGRLGDIRCSSPYASLPYGNVNQAVFLNAVVCAGFTGNIFSLLEELQQIEAAMGRIRRKKWEARIIDLDILFWGQKVIDQPQLRIPHYDYKNRDFFLAPALELAPTYTPPDSDKSLTALLAECPTKTLILDYDHV